MKRLSTIATFATLGAAFVFDGNTAAVLAGIVTVVGLTLTVASWIDKRIEHKINNHAALSRLQYHIVLREISNLRELGGHPPLNIPELVKESA